MIDIFADIKPQPKLYIADVTVEARYKPRKNSKNVEVYKVTLESNPIVLVDGEFPTSRMRENFLRRTFLARINKGKFENASVRVVKIDNCKFSSELAYKFNYDIH